MGTPQNITLTTLLALRGMPQAALARAVSSSEASVSRWCKGLEPSVSKQRQIADTLELTEHEFACLGWDTDWTDVREEKAGV